MFLPNTFRFSQPTQRTWINSPNIFQRISKAFQVYREKYWTCVVTEDLCRFACVCEWMSWKILLANPLKPDEEKNKGDESKKNYFYEKIGQV